MSSLLQKSREVLVSLQIFEYLIKVVLINFVRKLHHDQCVSQVTIRLRRRAIVPSTICKHNDVKRVCQLAALAIPDSLRRQRWIPTSPRGKDTDRRRDGLNQHAERNHQQRQACAGSVDVGLEPRFVWHAEKFR